MEKEQLVNSCFSGFSRLMNMFMEMQRTVRDFGTGEKLFPSEIHLTEAVGNNPQSSISDLSRLMGITRGAVQQVSTQLEEKGYILREESAIDKKKIILSLTKKNESAHRGHHVFHEKMYHDIFSQLNRFTGKELEKAISVFTSMEENFKSYLRVR